MPTDSSLVIYTSVPTPYIPIATNQNLQTILQNIDAAINVHNTAPDYSGYNLGPWCGYTVVQTDGISHPTNTQNFAEGISKILGCFQNDFYTFTGTTYPADQGVITAAIAAIQVPGLAYTHTAGGGSITITNTMTLNQTLTAIYTPIGDILDLLAAPGNTWGTLSISTPTNILDAFNDLITYLSTLTTTVNGKQAAIGTFDNTDCLGGGATDSITTTIGLLKTYICGLPTFDPGSITWGCVASQTTLQDTIQAVINSVSSLQRDYVNSVGAGIIFTPNGTCLGGTVAIDTAWNGIYKVLSHSGDPSPGFLDAKTISPNSTISLTPYGNQLAIDVDPTLAHKIGKVLINLSDPTAGFLQTKIPSTAGTWGIAINATASADNTQLILTPEVVDPTILISNILSYISTDPDLLAAFCSLQLQCTDCTCIAPTNLAVTLDGSFGLTWTPSGSALAQTVKYRQRGYIDWISTVNISAPNPQTNVANSATVSGLNTNVVYQFQVDSNCSGASNGTRIVEDIRYSCQTPSITVVGSVISITQDPMPSVDTITYQLWDSGPTLIATLFATGISPGVTFPSEANGTYTVRWIMNTLVNGVEVYSNDATQLTTYCETDPITISV